MFKQTGSQSGMAAGMNGIKAIPQYSNADAIYL